MTDRKTAFEIACALHDETGLPVFPVRLSRAAEGRWQKIPLVKWGSISGDPRELVWQGASAIGVPMGSRSGLIAIDLDDYKDGAEADQWLRTHHVPSTRTHSTASGGRHLIFQLPRGQEFGNKAPPVNGLDIRGNGGYIVWADVAGRYGVLDDTPPTLLPASICAELLALQSTHSGKSRYNAPLSDADLPDFQHVSPTDLIRKLEAALNNVSDKSLSARFSGNTDGLKDGSMSAMDMAVASLLAARGFGFNEIVQTLLTHFQYGTARRDGWTEKTERGAMRCAARALRCQETRREAQLEILRQTLGRFQPSQKNTKEIGQ